MAIQITKEDFQKKFGYSFGSTPDSFSTAQPQQNTSSSSEPGIFSRLKTDFFNRADAYGATSNQNPLSRGLQLAGQGAGLVTDAIGEGVKSTLGALPEAVKAPVKSSAIAVLQTPIGQLGLHAIQSGQESYNAFKAVHPEAAGNIESVVNIASLFPAGKVTELGAKGVLKTAELGLKAAQPLVDVAKTTGSLAKGIAVGTKDVAEMALRGAERIPTRVATNVAEKKATLETIKSLPSKVARNAAQDGVAVDDIKTIANLPADNKSSLKTLATVAKNFSEGTSKINPIEEVGKPIINRIKELDSARSIIGKKLGNAANNIGDLSEKELTDSVMGSLEKVPGLQGIKRGISDEGLLDFSNTNLATSLSEADRGSIQKAFIEATRPGSGQSKHLLRQEIFEILGGKKKSLSNITDTQEKAYQAIRNGLSNVLESKDAQYKVLSNDYRKVVQPLSDMRRFMKSVNGADEDILDMTAGLLARRLTSNAQSNPQIRQILRAMDEATKVKGKAKLSVESLQDFYNILDKYYNIAGKTTFQGQITAGLEKSDSIKGALMNTVKGFAGSTDAVKRKALENLIDSSF